MQVLFPLKVRYPENVIITKWKQKKYPNDGERKKKNFNSNKYRDFPGGAVVKNRPANAGDTGSSPGPGRSHRPRSN